MCDVLCVVCIEFDSLCRVQCVRRNMYDAMCDLLCVVCGVQFINAVTSE